VNPDEFNESLGLTESKPSSSTSSNTNSTISNTDGDISTIDTDGSGLVTIKEAKQLASACQSQAITGYTLICETMMETGWSENRISIRSHNKKLGTPQAFFVAILAVFPFLV
jgi:hypothetical protein